MAAQTTNLFLLEDLEDSSKTRDLADSDLTALRAIADWIKTFVVEPHKDLGSRWDRLSVRAWVIGTQGPLARS